MIMMLKFKLEPLPDSDLVVIRDADNVAWGAVHVDMFADSNVRGVIYKRLLDNESVEVGMEEYQWSRLSP